MSFLTIDFENVSIVEIWQLKNVEIILFADEIDIILACIFTKTPISRVIYFLPSLRIMKCLFKIRVFSLPNKTDFSFIEKSKLVNSLLNIAKYCIGARMSTHGNFMETQNTHGMHIQLFQPSFRRSSENRTCKSVVVGLWGASQW